MSLATHQDHVKAVIDLIKRRQTTKGRIVVAIAGPPASGKTTLAHSVVQELNRQGRAQRPRTKQPVAALLAMDGYHLDNDTLDRLGLLSRKGAVETFDHQGFCADLDDVLRAQRDVLLPSFDRERDQVVPRANAIARGTNIVVAEGNYLLLDQPPWSVAYRKYTATVFVKAPLAILRQRLMERWAEHGLTPSAARQKVEQNDLLNAAVVLDNRLAADLEITHAVHDSLAIAGDGGQKTSQQALYEPLN